MGQNLTGARPSDGTFVTLWRLLLAYPEILDWESLWFHSQEEVYSLLYGTAKEANSKARVGWHIMHLVTMSPLYRAEQDYARLARFSDFLKPSTYNNCGGRALHSTSETFNPRFSRLPSGRGS